MSTPLQVTHLRFDVVTEGALNLDSYRVGSWLRGGLGNVLLRTTCPDVTPRHKPTAAHAAVCPACRILAGEENKGQVTRVYTLVPPLPLPGRLAAGDGFSFVISMLGEGHKYFPYFALAVPEVGRNGIGPSPHARIPFRLEGIESVNPFTGQSAQVLIPGTELIMPHLAAVCWQDVVDRADKLLARMRDGRLCIRFLSPTRLVEAKRLAKQPDFGVFFRRLLFRLDALGKQYAGAQRRPHDEIDGLHRLADRVRLVESDVCWVDHTSRSGRTKRKMPQGGFVGQAVYSSEDWSVLLPWVLFGQSVQVGKFAVKGFGVYQVDLGNEGYWQRLFVR